LIPIEKIEELKVGDKLFYIAPRGKGVASNKNGSFKCIATITTKWIRTTTGQEIPINVLPTTDRWWLTRKDYECWANAQESRDKLVDSLRKHLPNMTKWDVDTIAEILDKYEESECSF